jgi:predicted phage baseplate assembly protein
LWVLSSSIGAPSSRSGEDATAPVVDWQFWDGAAWLDFEVSDETGALTRAGAITLVAPPGARKRCDFVDTLPLYWFRVVPRDGVAWRPALRAVLGNTVLAAHRLTIDTEVLGSSHATPHQLFEVLHRPVLEGELLQVREPASAPPLARDEQADEDGERDTESGNAIWRRWRPVDDFLSSAADDRHYVIDRTRGVVEFGDGQHGRIPPSGSNNVRLRRYESGGGARGNVPAGAVNQLRSAVPYIAAAGNLIAAVGGADIEPTDRVRHRGATLPRHRQRAVTVEDYQDLAILASPQVVRAECVPLFDLSLDPSVRRRQPGLVSVIVVPDAATSRPAPDPELLRQVRDHLDRCRNTSTDLVVVGPDYVEIDVEVDVAVGDANVAGDVSRTLRLSIEAFLHPLSGGTRGEGWRLGELPERSDLYAMCASIPGVTWVDALRVVQREDRGGLLRAGHFMTCSGRHRVAVRYTRDHTSYTLAGRSA